jgi:hypothetical protein
METEGLLPNGDLDVSRGTVEQLLIAFEDTLPIQPILSWDTDDLWSPAEFYLMLTIGKMCRSKDPSRLFQSADPAGDFMRPRFHGSAYFYEAIYGHHDTSNGNLGLARAKILIAHVFILLDKAVAGLQCMREAIEICGERPCQGSTLHRCRMVCEWHCG